MSNRARIHSYSELKALYSICSGPLGTRVVETAEPSETCSPWHKISVQIPVMPSVKGLHYALRIWTTQIFGLVIMMLCPHPHGSLGPTPGPVFLHRRNRHKMPPLRSHESNEKNKTKERQQFIICYSKINNNKVGFVWGFKSIFIISE